MTAIKVENLGKRYIIDHQKQQGHYRYETLGGALSSLGRRAFQQLRHPLYNANNSIEHEDFWALKDINFEINQGDRVGIIGRNGAGKSTLLKILSRITAPTTGKITINGRVSSLLEVGTGFHPELTGRENIFLNGAILGMKRQEIKSKFDEIVAFAEVEKFLDTPVKYYSSGMYVRLAFAVAAHLEPEILIVDEVLAVGDIQFQKKCLGKMEEVSNEGRTLLFVSHNIAAIQALCNRGLVLENGTNIFDGCIVDAIFHYNENRANNGKLKQEKSNASVADIQIINIDNNEITPTSKLQFSITINARYNLPKCYLNLVIENSDGKVIIHKRSDQIDAFPMFDKGIHEIDFQFDKTYLRADVYSVFFRLYCNTDAVYEMIDSDRIILEVKGWTATTGIMDIPCKWIIDGKTIDIG